MRTFTYRFIQAVRKYLRFAFKQGLLVSGTSLRSEHSPSGFYSFGAHGGRLPPSSGDLGRAVSRQLADPPSRSTSLVTTSGPAFKNAGPGRFSSKRKEIGAGPSAGYPVSRNSPTFGPRGGLAPKLESKAQEIAACACQLFPLRAWSYHQVAQLMGLLNWASGLIPLGRLYLRPIQRYFHSHVGQTPRSLPAYSSIGRA